MSVINIDFWSKKTVLVTGAAGFIGGHLCERLLNKGSKVRALIRYNSANSYGLIEFIPAETRKKIEIIAGDITDETSLHNAMKNTDIVFHMAAIPSIPYSFINPRHVFQVNTYGTLAVLMASKSAGVSQVILASSAGASEKRPVMSPYIMSKAAMEKVGLGFHQGLNLALSIVRLMNNYGPRQSARSIVPTIISQALVRSDVHLGALEPRMDFNYVDDTLEALMRTAEKEEAKGKILTWGTGNSISIKELAEMIFSIIGNKKLHIVTDPKRVRPYPGPMASLEEDIKDTQILLDYSPTTTLRAGLDKTLRWISGHPEYYKTEIYNI